jgi:hypothetical protein
MNFRIKYAINYLNDPHIIIKDGRIVVRWIHTTEVAYNNTMLLIIDCLHEMGVHGLVWLELNFRLSKDVIVKHTEELFIYQIPNNKSLTNDTRGSIGSRHNK